MSVGIRPTPPAQDNVRQNVTLQIVSVVMFIFIDYLTIGIPLVVLPGCVHDDLGYGPVLASLVVSLQYLATLPIRSYTGRVIGGLGPKRAVFHGMTGSTMSGLFMLLSVTIRGWSTLSPTSLLVGRLVPGAAESLVGSAAIGWGIGRVDTSHTTKMISWNDIASRDTIALGVSPGMLLVQWLGLWSMGVSIVLLGALGSVLAWPKLPASLVYGERLSFHHILDRVTPHGMGLALGTISFDITATFITFYHASRGWANTVFCLNAFGGCFIGARLLFVNSINRLGGFRVTAICLGVESLGLLLLWSVPNPWIGLVGTVSTDFGFSLVFPVFGVEAVSLVSVSNRGTALGTYSLFVDPSLGITGPLVGFVANLFDFHSMFFFACLASLDGLALAVVLHRRDRRPG